MSKISETLKVAQQRAKDMSLPYEGALLPAEAYLILQEAPSAKLVDVRTRAEWEWVGFIPGSVQIEWQTYPGGQPNSHFMDALTQQVDKESLVMFLCRSGARSHTAAAMATQSGYLDCWLACGWFALEARLIV
jgi:rhodanese-related sulfurtransferase